MTPIIAGRFDQESQATVAVESLRRQGFSSDEVSVFFLNPPGQHATFPVGGDSDASIGATDAHNGAMKGAAVGGAVGLGIGLAVSPLLGPLGPLAGAGAGAYAGSLVGAFGDMKDPAEAAADAAETPHSSDPLPPKSAPDVAAPRPCGYMVAARIADVIKRSTAVEILRSAGALDLEQAEGIWQAGKWVDLRSRCGRRVWWSPTRRRHACRGNS